MYIILNMNLFFFFFSLCFFFFQAEDGIRDLVRSRGLGDVYKRQQQDWSQNNSPYLPEVLSLLNQRNNNILYLQRVRSIEECVLSFVQNSKQPDLNLMHSFRI